MDCNDIQYKVRGVLGATGMSWEVSLSEVNAGMPLTVGDMYAFGEQSLYLIKVRFTSSNSFCTFLNFIMLEC